mmetsp:Transcript_23632/g.51166  ORF Transcript_23632/g.51166 Transcript_23632/m.51166 type:complete len:249 (-) Transcript_23632:203-949(-)|eukprot:CAMPEP_0172327062 /NCGR_PEP_ID=MMETSP1058-20130122/58461_1 /TAXON_ID=83371 /ORGANISM="Detonula confervacea, Strain CCMP 353" /LENGTH=248 /DNA_ID=CAMNT_0013044001 /DNA_START=147 /DNA_END=893 /DNA_ORIENTATION=+
MAKKDRNQEDHSTAAETEADSIYDSILSSCCGSSSSDNSFARKDKKKEKAHPQQQQVKDIEQSPRLFERLSDVVLFLSGAAPPVKFVRCFECPSVDGSELTTPRPLVELANEYDRDNKWKVQSMWSISEDLTDTSDDHNNMQHRSSAAAASSNPSRISQKPPRTQRRSSSGGGRWLRLKSSGSKGSEGPSQSRSRTSQSRSRSRSGQGGPSRTDNKTRARGGWSRPPVGRSSNKSRSSKSHRSVRVEV